MANIIMGVIALIMIPITILHILREYDTETATILISLILLVIGGLILVIFFPDFFRYY
jgi:hypothetical protein